MISVALIFFLSLALTTNSLYILNHMTPSTSHWARAFYTGTALVGFSLLLAQPVWYWGAVWLYGGFVALHLAYEPSFVKSRHIPWLFGASLHKEERL